MQWANAKTEQSPLAIDCYRALKGLHLLYRWTEETIRTEFREELEFVVRYREAREKMESIVELSDTARNRFVQFCLQNEGRLSETKRTRYFSTLTDEEVRALEQIVQEHLLPLGRPR